MKNTAEITGKQVIETYIHRYPQLTLPIAQGMSHSEAYKNIVRKGRMPAEYPNQFRGTEEDCIFQIQTPAGRAELLYLADRKDFEAFVQVLSCKCEKKEIPSSMGALYIGGISNWRKIHAHKKAYLEAGNTDWSAEFKRFTAKAENYKDRVILLSKGCYSALPACETPYSEEAWLRHSLVIRAYHELTHFVCRSLYPQQKDVLWDEIAADCIGICQALGHYDAALAEKLLGIEGTSYRTGGRLENYAESQDELTKYRGRAKEMIRSIAQKLEQDGAGAADCWETLARIQEIGPGIERLPQA